MIFSLTLKERWVSAVLLILLAMESLWKSNNLTLVNQLVNDKAEIGIVNSLVSTTSISFHFKRYRSWLTRLSISYPQESDKSKCTITFSMLASLSDLVSSLFLNWRISCMRRCCSCCNRSSSYKLRKSTWKNIFFHLNFDCISSASSLEFLPQIRTIIL